MTEPGALVLAITGAAGSGKSTVAAGIAGLLPRCAHIDVDAVKHMIVSGFFVDPANPEDPEGWGFSEWRLVGESVGLLAGHLRSKGFDVIVSGYLDEEGWDGVEDRLRIDHRILLLPDLATTIERDATREGEAVMGREIVERHYRLFAEGKFFRDFRRLDTSDSTVEETVSEILGILGR
jgi:hypothetical protein